MEVWVYVCIEKNIYLRKSYFPPLPNGIIFINSPFDVSFFIVSNNYRRFWESFLSKHISKFLAATDINIYSNVARQNVNNKYHDKKHKDIIHTIKSISTYVLKI